MNARTVAIAIALALTMTGCASPRRAPEPGDPRIVRCGEDECHVKITVSECRVTTVDPEYIEIIKKNVNIHWDIVSGDFTFPEQGGIVIKDYDPEREFTDPSRPNPKKVILKDKNSFAKYFPYGVQVLNRDGVKCPLHDPGVINHG